MSTEIKELRVTPRENFKRIMYLAKEFLLNDEVIDVVAGTQAAPAASMAAENLRRLNYITYNDIITNTSIINGRRVTKFVIRVKKTGDFKKLYDENLAKRKEFQERETKPTPTEK